VKTASRLNGKVVCIFGLVLLSLGSCGQIQAEDGSRERYFPNVTLTTQDNKDVRFYEDLIKGKIVLINFFYTRCDGELCDAGTRNLVTVQKDLGERLGRDVFIYSITFDPEHDTPEVLKKYAEDYGAKPGWLFLTGKPADIELLRNKLGMSTTALKADANPKRHTGMIKIGNDAIDKWTSASVLSKPERILELIGRVKPPIRTAQ